MGCGDDDEGALLERDAAAAPALVIDGAVRDGGLDAAPSPLDALASAPAQPSEDAGLVHGERLVVSDSNAERLYVFAADTGQLVADWPEVAVADHPGFLALPDGRLLFVDGRTHELVSARIAGVETPSIQWRAAIAGEVAHVAVDPGAKWAVCSSASEQAGQPGTLTVVSLQDGTSKSAPVMTGEPGVAVGGDPLLVFHRNDAPPEFEAFSLDELRTGQATARFRVSIGEGPHGEVIAHSRNKIVSAAADGIYVVPYTATGFGSAVRVPYEVDGLSGGRAFYARLSGDGRYLYSYLRDDQLGEVPWSQWRNDIYIVDLESDTARRIPVGNGLVYRLGACKDLAAFTQYAPAGDLLYLLDARQGSATFQTVIAKVPLEGLSKAPAADGDVWASEAFRITALSSDCRHAYVTHGGDGKVSVIDTAQQRVVRTITTPTALAYGGYLVSVQTDQPLFDTIGR
ncbi:MAG TPA: hypothetical protein VFX59_29400 [Polyangiales bacterium]|nr:hypothetical protein [Polyangiales bacterium]